MQTTQTQMGDGQIVFAKIFRDENPNNWAIITKGYIKKITRQEGLFLKDKYGFRPFQFGYAGMIYSDVFRGALKVVN
jgi:hypothetical protein